MKVFVTGGTGRLGNVVVRKLLEQNHEVSVLLGPDSKDHPALKNLNVTPVEGDIRDKKILDKSVKNCDWVFHLAAKVALRPDIDKSIWNINAEGSKIIAQSCLENNVSRFIFCGSHHSLNRFPYDQPMDENRELALDEFCAYHRSKAWGEKYTLEFIDKGLDVVVVSPGTIIGPFAFEPGILDQALIDLYNGKIPALINGQTDYADVRDIADGAIKAAEIGKKGERYLLTGDMLTMKELTVLLNEITGKKMPKLFLPIGLMKTLIPFEKIAAKMQKREPLFNREVLHAARSPEILHGKATAELGFHPRSAKDAFISTFDWFKEVGWIE